MNGSTRLFDTSPNQRQEHISAICLKINKYLLWIPVLPSLFFATSMLAYLKMLGLIRTLPGFMLIFGLLSYTLVYALSFALSPKYYEKQQYTTSIAISLSPLACIILAAAGHFLISL
jgi:hypothetical protein